MQVGELPEIERDDLRTTAFLSLPTDDSRRSRTKRRIWQRLVPLERALLATDGSFTLLLQALHGEPIRTQALEQTMYVLDKPHRQLDLDTGDYVLKRQVVLKTLNTGRPVVYAESHIVHSRLPLKIRRQLQEGNKPIGLLLRAQAAETHRKLQDWGVCPASHDSHNFLPAKNIIFRTYSIVSNSLPLMLVSEYFPVSNNV